MRVIILRLFLEAFFNNSGLAKRVDLQFGSFRY